MLGFWSQKLDFQNIFQNRHSLISFQQLELNRHYLWNMRVDFRTRLSNRKNIDWICKILDRNDIGTSQHSFKIWAVVGQFEQYSDQIWAVFGSDREQWKLIKWWLNELRTIRFKKNIINEQAHLDHTGAI